MIGRTDAWTGTRSKGARMGEQVVDAHGVAALEGVGRRRCVEIPLEAQQRFAEGPDEVRLDGRPDDRESVASDSFEVGVEGPFVHRSLVSP